MKIRFLECDTPGEWMWCPFPWHWKWGLYVDENGDVCNFYGPFAKFLGNKKDLHYGKS